MMSEPGKNAGTATKRRGKPKADPQEILIRLAEKTAEISQLLAQLPPSGASRTEDHLLGPTDVLLVYDLQLHDRNGIVHERPIKGCIVMPGFVEDLNLPQAHSTMLLYLESFIRPFRTVIQNFVTKHRRFEPVKGTGIGQKALPGNQSGNPMTAFDSE